MRTDLHPERPYELLLEEEPGGDGERAGILTVFLTSCECAWHCVMCDLWKNTLPRPVAEGAIPKQIDFSLAQLEAKTSTNTGAPSHAPRLKEARENRSPVRWIKLYNSGSFFDPRAVPIVDYPVIARQLSSFERVIVECHPALVGDVCLRFQDLLGGKLEVAMGLETAHPGVLKRLNKGMSLDLFAKAARFLAARQIDLRTFVLVKPPYLEEAEALLWAQRSIDFAVECGASAVSLIPTRSGNPALDDVARAGHFSPPKLETLESAQAYGIAQKGCRVFADLWDLHRFADCPDCFPARRDRLHRMNLSQALLPPVSCHQIANHGLPVV